MIEAFILMMDIFKNLRKRSMKIKKYNTHVYHVFLLKLVSENIPQTLFSNNFLLFSLIIGICINKSFFEKNKSKLTEMYKNIVTIMYDVE